MQHLSRPSIPTVTRPEQQPLQREASQAAHMGQQQQQHASSHSSRPALAPSLRWLQFCLLLLFDHDVLCFSLGYPFLPSIFGGAATGAAFSCYGLASIAVLLLLLFFSGSNSYSSNSSSSSSSSSNPISQVNAASAAAASKFWRIVSAATLAAAAGAANTVLPSSFPMLLLTKATQGAASALYFCDSLSLVAAVYPRAYRTQAMAFISAGLTVGDALGPVVGGLVFQAAGLQAALGLQPAASIAAVLAWGLLLLWRRDARPWSVCTAAAPAHAAGDSSAQWDVRVAGTSAAVVGMQAGAAFPASASKCRGNRCRSQAIAHDSVLEPLLASEQAVASPTAVMAAWINRATAAAGAQQTASAAVSKGLYAKPAAGGTSRLRLLQQLLQQPAILSLCVLALLAQAARTAVDLLLPVMLQGYVQPGVTGLLFAGEAVGSVVAPFFVDWLLHRHTSQPASTPGDKPSRSPRRVSSSGSSSGSCSSSIEYASWLLLLSSVGMALCCAAVLTAWQLPAALRTAPLVSTAAAQPPGTVHTGFAVLRAAVQPSFLLRRAAEDAAAVVGAGAEGVLFGLAELLVIVFVLMLLGSCHSSCETLIYTVLTDIIAPSESETVSDVSAVAQLSDALESDVSVTCCQYSSCHDSFQESGKSDCSCEAQLPYSTNCFDCAEQQLLYGVDASSECSVRGAVHAVGDSSAAGSAVLAVNGCGVQGSGSEHGSVLDAASVAACADVPGDASVDALEYDLQIQVGDGGTSSCSTLCVCSHSDLSRLHCHSNNLLVSGCYMGDQSHTYAVQNCESQPESDCTEVVMVLYVLFWVVGFSVGAGLVGVLPGTELVQLQAVACVLAALLAGVGRWTWSAVSC